MFHAAGSLLPGSHSPGARCDDFCEFLLRDLARWSNGHIGSRFGILCHAGLGKNEVRIAYVLDRERLDCAVRILSAGLGLIAPSRAILAVSAFQTESRQQGGRVGVTTHELPEELCRVVLVTPS